jgi:hypothetical protein
MSKWVICKWEDAHCGKVPCMALIDDDIKIEHFKECFYSNIQTNWRNALEREIMEANLA